MMKLRTMLKTVATTLAGLIWVSAAAVNAQPKDEGYAAYTAGNIAQAKAIWEPRCAANDSLACTYLAFLYQKGDGVQIDLPKARTLFEKGCVGNSLACSVLGEMHQYGEGGPVDDIKARALYSKACTGSADEISCYNVAAMMRAGTGGPKQPAEALITFALQCDNGHLPSCNTGGQMLEKGETGKPDYVLAEKMYRMSCDKGNQTGCTLTGELYRNGLAVVK